MSKSEQRYDAFISYRHIQPDRSVAERIHKKLEAFRLPKEVAAKIGKNRLNRVFRDEAEFAVSDDLSEAITEALKQSDYLIVVASPKYLESPWCIREVETFVQLKDRKHILVVLADGEPDNAFPKILTYEEIVKTDEDGREVREVINHEPLAADCRAEKSVERNRKVDLAVIRLIASIFDLSFDDLKQRQREAELNRRRRNAIIIIAVLVVVLAQSIYFSTRIARQNRLIKEKNEAVMAATSSTLLSEGKRMDAIYTARSILPDRYDKNFNNEAAVALVNALEIYTESDEYVLKDDIHLAYSAVDITYSETGKYASLYTADSIQYIIDTRTGEEIYKIKSAYNGIGFDGDKGILYRNDDGEYRYFSLETKMDTLLAFREEGMVENLPTGKGVGIFHKSGITVVSEGKILYEVNCEEILNQFGLEDPSRACYFSADGKYAVLFFNFLLSKSTAVVKVSLFNGEIEQIATISLNVVNACIRNNKMVYYGYSYDDEASYEFSVMNISSGDILASRAASGSVYSVLMNDQEILAVESDQMTFYDMNLNPLTTKGMKDTYTLALVSPDGVFFVADVAGYYYMTAGGELKTGEIGKNRSKIYTSVAFFNDQNYVNMYGTNYISVYGKKDSYYLHPYTDEKDLVLFEYTEENFNDGLDFNKRVLKSDPDLQNISIRNYGVSIGGNLGYVQTGDGQLRLYDPDSCKLLKKTYSVEGMVFSCIYDDRSNMYVIVSDSLEFFDKNLNHMISLQGISIIGYDANTKALVGYDNDIKMYSIDVITYEVMIRTADEILGDYEPDERTKEKYGL